MFYTRYVVRAKQGGRQSAKDGTGRAPKSGGASLRRYNEAALEKVGHLPLPRDFGKPGHCPIPFWSG